MCPNCCWCVVTPSAMVHTFLISGQPSSSYDELALMQQSYVMWWVMSVAGSRVMGVAGNRVLFLVLEGLTDDLLDRIATPALDAVASAGHRLKLKPEFPAETLPTLQVREHVRNLYS